MNRLSTRQLTLIAIVVVLMVVGGWVLFTLGAFLGVPGLKYVLMGPYFSFCLYFPDRKLGGRWLLSLISVVFGLVMMLISPFMGPAIALTGLATDLLAQVFRLGRKGKLALYPTLGFLLTYWVTTYVTGLLLLGPLGWIPALLLALLTFGLGLAGGHLAKTLYHRVLGLDGFQ